jgi:magnesium transporter
MKKSTLGLAPGSLVYEGGSQAMHFRVVSIMEESVIENKVSSLEELLPLIKNKKEVLWVQVIGLGAMEKLQQFGETFSIDTLVLEDILNQQQRPKGDIHEEYDFITLRYFSSTNNEIRNEQISIILRDNILFSFQDTEEALFLPLEKRFALKRKKKNPSRISLYKYPYLAYAIIDYLTDQHFLVQEHFEEKIEQLSQMIHQGEEHEIRLQIHQIRIELLSFRKAVLPLSELINTIRKSPQFWEHKKSLDIYLNDLNDHVLHLQELMRTHSETLESLSSLYFSITADKTNKTMQILTAITLTFLPLTFLAGVYGMNFKFMPELDKPWAYPLLLGIMLCIAASILYFFRKKKWL